MNTKKETILQVKTTPNAKSNRIIKFQHNILMVAVKSKPEHGKANNSLIKLLTEFFKLTKSEITIKTGVTNRLKLIKICGYTKEELNKWIIKKL